MRWSKQIIEAMKVRSRERVVRNSGIEDEGRVVL